MDRYTPGGGRISGKYFVRSVDVCASETEEWRTYKIPAAKTHIRMSFWVLGISSLLITGSGSSAVAKSCTENQMMSQCFKMESL